MILVFTTCAVTGLGQETLTAQLSALLHDILSQVDSQRLRLVDVTVAGYDPSAYYHSVLQNGCHLWTTLQTASKNSFRGLSIV